VKKTTGVSELVRLVDTGGGSGRNTGDACSFAASDTSLSKSRDILACFDRRLAADA
jgi:hypothetical protein